MTSPVHLPPELRTVTSGIATPEGPAIAPDGSLHVVNAESGLVYRIASDGSAQELVKTGGRPNGLAFGPTGELYIADTGLKAILLLRPNGTLERFVDHYGGTQFGGPNDLTFLLSGDMLFTDPIRRPMPDPCISPVYRAAPNGAVDVFASDLAFPNGIALSHDKREVYVAEMRANRIVSFTIQQNGTLSGQRMIRRFADPAMPDGMAVDVEGRILAALPGIRAIALLAPEGKLIDLYHSEGWQPSNLAFGGPDLRTVYVSDQASGSILGFRHDVPGAPLL
ncbi:MAG: SMP-30/gluconolactonase/LRE family protein [Dehalococcoidia bacterium]